MPVSRFFLNHDVWTNRSAMQEWATYDAYASENSQIEPPRPRRKRKKQATTVQRKRARTSASE